MQPEHLDVLIVGAGIAGIGAGAHLRTSCPQKSIAILDAREAIGGTWDLFRYPGIRSDSDMFTLGYSFKPWRQASVFADGPAILEYLSETVREYGLEELIRLGHHVISADWHSDEARWYVEVQRPGTGERLTMTCNMLHMCAGYYSYENGYAPHFSGQERFQGTLIHPQDWPRDFDYSGKQVVIIGSGATAVTLVPAMVEKAARVTMLQRSPSYVAALPSRDPVAERLGRWLSPQRTHTIVRWKNILRSTAFYQLCRRRPDLIRGLIRRGTARALPEGFDVDTHFKPRYNPWDQRVCIAPDGDFFKALSSGKAAIVTDRIDSFTEHGIRLESGQELEADVVITATGLVMKLLGGVQLSVDGASQDASEHVIYKGAMVTGIPNMTMAFGYTNNSWTLRCDLVADYLCRLLQYMDDNGYRQCVPIEPDESVKRTRLLNLSSGYVERGGDLLPKQATREPWRLHQNYLLDLRTIKHRKIADVGLELSSPAGRPSREAEPAAVA